MDIRFYWAILWRRKWVVVSTVALAMLVTIIGTVLMVPRYVGSATLRMATAATGSAVDQRYDTQYTDRLMNTYAKLATSEPIVQELAQRMAAQKHITVDVQRLLKGDIQVEILANTELMKISVEDDDPTVAADAANTLGQVLIDDYKANSSGGNTNLASMRTQLDQVAKDLISLVKPMSSWSPVLQPLQMRSPRPKARSMLINKLMPACPTTMNRHS